MFERIDIFIVRLSSPDCKIINQFCLDFGDVIALTVVSSGTDDADRINRIAAMDAMVSKNNVVNKQGFVVAFSEIENVKPGGITGIAVTIDS